MPSELELKWLDTVIETGDPIEAVKRVYPNCGQDARNPDAVIRSRAHQLKSKLKAEFAARVHEQILYFAPNIISNLARLAGGADSEAVRYSASKDLLDRAYIGTQSDSASQGVTITINRDNVVIDDNSKLSNEQKVITGEVLRVADPQ